MDREGADDAVHPVREREDTAGRAHAPGRAALAVPWVPAPLHRPLGQRVSGRGSTDEVIALAVRWYVRYRLSYADVAEWLAERGLTVNRSTVYRWVQRFLPLCGKAARLHRHTVGAKWRVDETYVRL